jgi:phenylpyruvate tautomerase PptA (4-oxalocrotonate tautomerase family)
MPLDAAIIQEGTISTETKATIAEEITRIHTTVMKVPKNLVRIPSHYRA